MPIYSAKMKAPFAVLGIRTGGGNVTGVEYLPRSVRLQAPTDAVAERACRQIERYLVDPQFRFSLPLAPAGTLFRRRVWDTLAEIPIGESRTYGELARQLHTAPRAVGGAPGAETHAPGGSPPRRRRPPRPPLGVYGVAPSGPRVNKRRVL